MSARKQGGCTFSVLFFQFLHLSQAYSTPLRPLCLLETERLLFVAKPAGVQFHSVNSDENIGLLGLIRSGQKEGWFEYTGDIFAVHRLDAVTSGIVMLAKDKDAAGRAARAFQRRTTDRNSAPLLRKKYLALLQRKIKPKGKVVGDMVRSRRGSWKLTRSTENPARTQFWSIGQLEPLNESYSLKTQPATRLVALEPETGRTHQLRVAMKALGAPILGDSLYGGGEQDRCYLHHAALEIDVVSLGLGYGGGEANGEQSGNLIVRAPPSTGELWMIPKFKPLWDKALRDGLL